MRRWTLRSTRTRPESHRRTDLEQVHAFAQRSYFHHNRRRRQEPARLSERGESAAEIGFRRGASGSRFRRQMALHGELSLLLVFTVDISAGGYRWLASGRYLWNGGSQRSTPAEAVLPGGRTHHHHHAQPYRRLSL